jgi:Ca2+-binding EF-hand superfamily protein
MSTKAVVLIFLTGLLLTGGESLADQEADGGSARESFESMDGDGDGRISWKEYSGASDEPDMERMMRRFQHLDQDSSGMISREEWDQDGR